MKLKVIIFDTETTGLLAPSSAPLDSQPSIIELGAVACDEQGELGELSQLINPGKQITPLITKITGITNEDLFDKPSFSDFLPKLVDFFSEADFLICHNASFDSAMLRHDLMRAGCCDFPWPKETICTVQEYQPLFGRRPKMVELYRRIVKKPLSQKHRALDDARALHEILVADDFFTKLFQSRQNSKI